MAQNVENPMCSDVGDLVHALYRARELGKTISWYARVCRYAENNDVLNLTQPLSGKALLAYAVAYVLMPLLTRLNRRALRSFVSHVGLKALTAWYSMVACIGAFCSRDRQEFLLWFFRNHYAPAARSFLKHVGGITFRIEGDASAYGPKTLFFSTHESELDVIVHWLREFYGRPLHLPKQALMKLPFFGWCLKHMGMIPVRHGKTIPSFLKAYKKALHQDDRQIIVYGQAALVPPFEEVQLHTGCVKLIRMAIKEEWVIVPMASNTWRGWGEPNKHFVGGPHECVITVGEPMTLDVTRSDRELLLQLTEALKALR